MKKYKDKSERIHIDLFSGAGGFSLGLINAGFEFSHHYYSEIDKHAIAVYSHKFKESKYVGSVTDVSGRELRKRHPRAKFIITFGFPCQDLSVAGEGKGLAGKRSGLFFQAIRIIHELGDAVEIFIFENVKGLLSSNEGKDFEVVLRTIADLGVYECEGQLVNTSWILPQNRERFYFIGHFRRRSKPRVFPFREADFINIYRDSRPTTIRAITAGGNSGGLHSNMTILKVKSATKAGYEIAEPGDSINLSVPGSKTRRGRVGKQKAQTLDTASQQVIVRPVLTPDRIEKKQNGRRIKEDGEPSFTLNTQDTQGIAIDERIRRLTEVECERLQGFPDNWTQYGNYDGKVKKISKTQRYKMMGNAVTTTIVQIIGERLI